MASKGGAGIRLDMNKVPCREEGMTPYEMMLSESQERMLMVLKPGREGEAEAIFPKWELDFAVIGEVTDTGHMVLEFDGEVVCDIPLGPARRRGALIRAPAHQPGRVQGVGRDQAARRRAGKRRTLPRTC
jgi:phosphoribosylformylglycinamidine synthase